MKIRSLLAAERSNVLREVLNGTLELFEHSDKWHQGDAFALDANVNPVDVDSQDACTWCLYGGVQKVLKEVLTAYPKGYGGTFLGNYIDCILNGIAHDMKSLYLESVDDEAIIVFNDDPDTSHNDVIMLLKKALEFCLDQRNRIDFTVLQGE